MTLATSRIPLLAIATVASMAAGCGSRLPRDVVIKRPLASSVTEIDLSQVMFTDIDSGESVNAGQYMDDHQKDYLLLTFGSRACSACNKKSRELRDRFLVGDGLQLVDGPTQLEVIGVNTDADSLTLTQRFVKSERFNFIRWSDPRGEAMLRWFMPEGRPYGVPLTVLVNRRGILWSYTNESTATVEEIIDRARRVAGEDANRPDPPPPTPTPEPGHSNAIPALAFVRPDRMRDVAVYACGDQDREVRGLASAMPLSSTATFFHVERAGCGEMCAANRDLLTRKINARIAGDLKGAFLFADDGKSPCAPVAAVPGKSREPRVFDFAGGKDFFDVFATHFDWNHAVREGEDMKLSLDPLAPAITLAFDRGGKLVFSAEGAIEESNLDAFLRSTWLPRNVPGAAPYARGPAWNFFGQPLPGQAGADMNFSEWRSKADFSVINVFGESCGSCMAEMSHWSRPGGLFSLCQETPDFCSFAALENGLPASAFTGPGMLSGQELDSYLSGIRSTLQNRGIFIPTLMLDPYSPENDGGLGYLKRFFDGYLSAKNPELGFDFRTVVTDREGKILGVFKATPPEDGKQDHVEEFLGRLRTARDKQQGSSL
jgi:hypothetical protein